MTQIHESEFELNANESREKMKQFHENILLGKTEILSFS